MEVNWASTLRESLILRSNPSENPGYDPFEAEAYPNTLLFDRRLLMLRFRVLKGHRMLLAGCPHLRPACCLRTWRT
jgi:hypothetical protein